MPKGDICQVEGCTNVVKWGKICEAHYARNWRHGNYDYNPNWNNLKAGQALRSPLGYLRINIGKKRVLHHRYVMEQHLSRPLTKDERLHHINGDKTDNRIENLELHINHSEHMKINHRYDWHKRQIRPPYTPEEISSVLDRIHFPPKTYQRCFCGKFVMARNLCSKHYQWAYDHNFIPKGTRPRKKPK